MTVYNWEFIRPILAKILAIGGLLLSSAGILGNSRLERLERINRKIRRRTKFSVFFNSSRPTIGKFFLFYTIIIYIAFIIILLLFPEFRRDFLHGDILTTILFLFGNTLISLLNFSVLYLLVKYKSPKQTYLAIHDYLRKIFPKEFYKSEIPKIRIFSQPIYLTLFR